MCVTLNFLCLHNNTPDYPLEGCDRDSEKLHLFQASSNWHRRRAEHLTLKAKYYGQLKLRSNLRTPVITRRRNLGGVLFIISGQTLLQGTRWATFIKFLSPVLRF